MFNTSPPVVWEQELEAGGCCTAVSCIAGEGRQGGGCSYLEIIRSYGSWREFGNSTRKPAVLDYSDILVTLRLLCQSAFCIQQINAEIFSRQKYVGTKFYAWLTSEMGWFVCLFVFILLAIKNKGFGEVLARYLPFIYFLNLRITVFLVLPNSLCVW